MGKVVPFNLRRLAAAAQYNSSYIGLAPGEVCLSMMPLYHIAGISVNLLPSLFAGATVLLLDGPFQATTFVAQLERNDKHAPTWYFAVPSVHAAVVQEAQILARPLHHKIRLVRSAGAALDPTLGQRLVALFDASVTPCYGMTEACEITCPPKTYRLSRAGSVGPAMACTVKIDNDIDPTNPCGEICVKGELLMEGYEWDGPADENPNTDAWTTDGFLRTGDVGTLDADGWIYLTGRSKEMINRGGETLNPYEVEDAFKDHPKIELVLAFACPHSILGECIAVVCVLRQGVHPKDVSLVAIREECQRRSLRQVMWPEVVVFAAKEVLPLTRTKKHIRAGLAARFGLKTDVLENGGRAFSFVGGTLVHEEDADDDAVMVQDSMAQVSRGDRRSQLIQKKINALYGVVIVNVMLNHWLPHEENTIPMPLWARECLYVFRSDKALMGLMFLLGGYSSVVQERAEGGGRRILLLSFVYVFMGWPLLSTATAELGTFHRWFLYWFIVCMLVGKLCDAVKLSASLAVVLPMLLAPCLSNVPDTLGEILAGMSYESAVEFPGAIFLNASFYWSMGHKVYWLGFFLLGYYYGPTFVACVWELPPQHQASLSSMVVRSTSLLTACTLAAVSVYCDDPHDGSVKPETNQDWPYFFTPILCYPLKVLLELAQMAFLGVAVGRGNPVTQILGANVLGTFVVHMYVSTQIAQFSTSLLFQQLNFFPVFGGLVQLAIVFLYPILFGLTLGPLLWQLALVCSDLLRKVARSCTSSSSDAPAGTGKGSHA
eukprot:gnl/TRDRNA2_/TRDRNA2_169264_c0_seq16.p1 gnl/TRDRNA2_/TRDRNA2_169264_c0~~gnl/TRDRNA2_/TRDRNA2_169264_c0_seq16.p1  ORF type:complete len:833 (+),score=109.73 gnl/TRDRNA2_/TRDRNA2_169264_c0_seq16:179-2500(+)